MWQLGVGKPDASIDLSKKTEKRESGNEMLFLWCIDSSRLVFFLFLAMF